MAEGRVAVGKIESWIASSKSAIIGQLNRYLAFGTWYLGFGLGIGFAKTRSNSYGTTSQELRTSLADCLTADR